jgi:hypothetical protein
MIVRIIVSTVLDGSDAVAPVEGTSPEVDTGGGGGVGDFPVDGTSPALAMPESAHARTTANVKRFILSIFSFELRMPVYWQETSLVYIHIAHLTRPQGLRLRSGRKQEFLHSPAKVHLS